MNENKPDVTQSELRRIEWIQDNLKIAFNHLSEKGQLALCMSVAQIIEPHIQKVKHLMEQNLKKQSLAKQWAAQTGLDTKKKELP